MKREIAATLLILFIVLRGITGTVDEVELNHAKEDPYYDAYGELIAQNLIFSDEFDGDLNLNWVIQDDETKYNRLSVNQAENVTVTEHGKLQLTTKQESDGSFTTPYMTVSKDDRGRNFNYGYYEARIKFSNNNEYPEQTSFIPGTNIYIPWGAFWLFPLASGSGQGTEIDIAENSVSNIVSSSVHEIDNYDAITEESASSWHKGVDYEVDPTHYHTYGVYVEPNLFENAATYSFYLDGQKMDTVISEHPLANQTIHLTMEIADELFTDGKQGEEIKEVANFEDETMLVDYVRVYEYNENL